MLTRRQFLTVGAGLGAGFLLHDLLRAKRTHAASPSLSQFTETLPISFPVSPPSTLTIASGSHSFHRSLGEVPTFGYGGLSYLGPTFEVTRATPVSITAVNNLGGHPLAARLDTDLHGVKASAATKPPTVVHLHGINTEARSDGYPEDSFLPGETYVYNFNNNQEAATLWYHDHTLGITGPNIQAGLAGLYLIRDADDPVGGNGPLGIPAGPPYEVPLVLQDQQFNSDGSIYFPSPWVDDFYANVSVVNGKAWPNLNVDRTMYRFRIVNASNSRFYRLKLSSKQQLIQIGTDQGFLNAPVYLSKLLLGPGERADVLIDFSDSLPGDKIVLQNDAAAPYPKGMGSVIDVFSADRGKGYYPLREVMQFTVNQGAAVRKVVPTTLRVSKPLIKRMTTQPVRKRFLTITDILNQNFQVVALLLNYVYWDEAVKYSNLMERPRVDTVEQWEIINLQPFSHTMHLHLIPFQILNRQTINYDTYNPAYNATGPRKVLSEHARRYGDTVPGGYPALDPYPEHTIGDPRPPAANEAGWKDTVVVNPFEVTRILVPFGAQAAANLPFGNSYTGRFVWHCHMFNHEDNEMMLPYEVIA